MNGLRSKWRGSISFSVIVGAVDKISNGWAINSLGFFFILFIVSSISFFGAFGPIIIPYPPEALAGLTTNLEIFSITYFLWTSSWHK